MKNLLTTWSLIIIFIGNINLVYAQDVTISDYIFNEKYENITDKREAVYLLRVEQQDDTTFINRFYYVQGTMIYQETYKDAKNDVAHGLFCWYNNYGEIDSSGYYFNNQKVGSWQYYNDKGLVKRVDFLNGVIQKEENITDSIVNEPFKKNIENKEAVFKWGGKSDSWIAYLIKKVDARIIKNYGIDKWKKGPYVCGVSFLIDKNGKINLRETYIRKSVHWVVDAEVLKIIRQCPS